MDFDPTSILFAALCVLFQNGVVLNKSMILAFQLIILGYRFVECLCDFGELFVVVK